jgi:hypothetical protein
MIESNYAGSKLRRERFHDTVIDLHFEPQILKPIHQYLLGKLTAKY